MARKPIKGLDPNEVWEAFLADREGEGLGGDAPPQAAIAFAIDYLIARYDCLPKRKPRRSRL